MFKFGTGAFFFTPTQDALGNAIATPTPLKVGTVQSGTLDYQRDLKELYGENNMPVDVAGGKIKLMGKLTAADVNGALLASLVFGQPMTAAQGFYISKDNAGTVPAASPYQLTPVPPNTGTFLFDLGVRDSNGLPMIKVAVGSTPTTGQYTVSAAGQYTFAAADAGRTVYYSYQYSVTAAASKQIVVRNAPMGNVPSARLDIQVPYKGNMQAMTLPNVVIGKTNLLGTKIDDFDFIDLDFQAFADPVTGLAITMNITN